MKIRLIFLSLLFSAFQFISYAQTIYGLNDCISIGLDKNFSILVAKNSETISKNNFTAGNAGYLPYITAGSRYAGAVTNTTQNLNDGTKNVTNGTFTNAASAYGNLSMNIFSGFNVSTTYKKLNELSQMGVLNTQMTIENYISSVVALYYLYVQQVQQYKNLDYAVLLSRERLRIDQERYYLKSSSKIEVLQSRVYLNSDSSRLITQAQVLRENQIRLNELMAVADIGAVFSLKDTTIHVDVALLHDKLLDETMKKNTSILLASKNKTISEYDYKLAVSRSYPYLDLTGGYTYAVNTNSAASYKNQFVNGPSFGLTMGVNVFDGFNQRRLIRNSSLDIKSKELKYSEIEQGVKADLESIYSAYQNNLTLIKMEEQNLATATENLSIALDRYKLGSLSGLDLRDVQKSLLDARERLLLVQYKAKVAEISLLQISGQIMNYYK
jgi:outer membrane protein, adhesin transport system